MSHLVQLLVHRVRLPLVRPFVTAVRRVEAIDAVLVEATDSDGRSGWGEAPTSWRVTGESPESVTAAVVGPLSESLDSAPLDDTTELAALVTQAIVGNASARSAVECALYDLSAQSAGLSLARSLGANADCTRITTDMTLSVGTVAEVLASARVHVAGGFHSIKLKASSSGEVLRNLVALRTEFGQDLNLRIDANQAWQPDEAIRVIHSIEDAGIDLEFVEQPVSALDLEGLARVTAAVNVPILADESVWTIRDLRDVIRLRAADSINIKLAKAGGLSEAMKLAAAARDADMEVIVGCMMESTVGVAAAASLAAAISPEATHDLDAGLWLREPSVTGGLRYENNFAMLGAGPGLGVSGITSRSAA
ncbi:mandelate racemase/muconate lactonizing enzyme family protein [Salinibacterium sp. M195]|uniref:mandelate racemase/muconate lactonizing enzyme family protein n=1 Tax=Salinibacterium sp. M195 TaxID=2583374 RepID=UPI001C63A5A3|nr:dipeptide epimerase [Salinibacterium sp. M195]QYH36575.1 dipeptide epimerase [Salinibacterium sp. M195]